MEREPVSNSEFSLQKVARESPVHCYCYSYSYCYCGKKNLQIIPSFLSEKLLKKVRSMREEKRLEKIGRLLHRRTASFMKNINNGEKKVEGLKNINNGNNGEKVENIKNGDKVENFKNGEKSGSSCLKC